MTEEEILNIAGKIWNSGSSFPIPSSDDILRFAQIVVGIEREACARLCDESANEAPNSWQFRMGANHCAEAVRARGQR
jgi:hypothetical protein